MRFLRANTDRTAKITLPGPFTMSQQAINEFYKDADEMVMDYAVAVNAEARDLVAAGADIIQLDEPWLRNDPDAAKRIAVKAINRALEGIKVPTIVHLCFGYAALVPGETKPVGYSFLPQLADTTAEQISIEAAQPKLDLGVLKDLAGKKILLGVLDLADKKAETPQVVAERIRAGLKHVAADKLIPAPDCGMKYLPRESGFRQAQGARRRRGHRAAAAGRLGRIHWSGRCSRRVILALEKSPRLAAQIAGGVDRRGRVRMGAAFATLVRLWQFVSRTGSRLQRSSPMHMPTPFL